jgi:hypothetical protein
MGGVLQNLGLFREIIFFEGRSKRDYWIRFSTFLAISAVIATVGMLRDSIAVIIAAMLIAPLMTPILGLSAAMTIGLVGRILRLLLLILTAAGGCVILAWLLAYVMGVPRGLAIPHPNFMCHFLIELLGSLVKAGRSRILFWLFFAHPFSSTEVIGVLLRLSTYFPSA